MIYFQTMRVAIVAISLLPYLYYGGKDNFYHFRGRRVSLMEHLLHLAIGILLVSAIASAFRGHIPMMLGALMVFLVAGGIDEYIYHRHIPEEETDLHAKGHMALLIFVVVAMVAQFLASHDWRFSTLFAR